MTALPDADRALEALLRRDRLIFFGGLTLVVVLSAAWIVAGAGMGMSALEMTGPLHLPGHDPGTMGSGMANNGGMAMAMQPAVWTLSYAILMFVMWSVMMTAMMLPSAAPLLLLYLKVARKSQTAAEPLAPAAVMALGYIAAWGGFSILATAAQWGLQEARLLSPMLHTTNDWLGGGILIAAGVWQLTPIKAACLRHCRSPVSFLSGHYRPGWMGAFRMGLTHGAYCLGCCWFLMALLFFGGVMNLYWIAGLAAFVLLEKTMPFGHWIGRAAGVGLATWGLSLIVV